MTKRVILELDDDDFGRMERIKNKISSISTPQDAVKWALKQSTKQWDDEAEFRADKPLTFQFVLEDETSLKYQPGIPEHQLPIIKLPPGEHLMEMPMSRLAGFEGTVVLATDTLKLLRGKK